MYRKSKFTFFALVVTLFVGGHPGFATTFEQMSDAQLIKWAFEQRKENPDLFQGSAGVIVLKHTSGFNDGNITIRRGDILLSLNGEAIQSTKHYRRLLMTITESGRNKLLFFLRNKMQYKIKLHPGNQVISVKNIGLRPAMIHFADAGKREFIKGSFDQALEQWLQAFDLAVLLEDEKHIEYLAVGIVAIYLDKNKYRETLPYLLRRLKYAKAAGDLQTQEEYSAIIGNVYLTLSMYHPSLSYVQKALAIAKKSNNKAAQALYHGELGKAYNGLEQYNRALKHSHIALALHNDLDDLGAKSEAYLAAGAAYTGLGQKEKALRSYKLALSLSNATKDYQFKALVLSDIANLYNTNMQFDKALRYYQQSLLIHSENDDKEGLATTLVNIGALYETTGEYDKALQQLNKALIIYQEIEMPNLRANLLNNIGSIYNKFDQHDKALAHFEQSLTIFERLGNKHSQGMIYVNIATTYLALGKLKLAFEFFDQAIKASYMLKDRRLEGKVLGNMGNAYQDMGNYEKALSSYQQSLSISKTLNDRLDEALNYIRIAGIYNLLSKHQEALAFAYKSLSINIELGIPSRLFMDYGSLHRTMHQLGQNQAAIFFGKLAVNAIQSMRTNMKGLDKSLKTCFMKGKERYYRSLINLLIEDNRILEAQKVIGMLKEKELFDFLRRAKPIKNKIVPIQCNPDEQVWCQRFKAISNNLVSISKALNELEFKKKSMRLNEQEIQTYQTLKKDSRIGKRAFAAFFENIKENFKTSKVGESRHDEFSHKRIQDHVSMQGVLTELSHGAVVIYYVVAKDQLSIILITPDISLAKTVAIPQKDLNQKVIAFRNALSHTKKDPHAPGRELYDLLFKPIAEALQKAKAKTLMLSLDGSLRYIPMSALYDGEQYLIEKYALAVYTPGNASSFFSLKDKPNDNWKAVGLGVSELDNCFVTPPAIDQTMAYMGTSDNEKICFQPLRSVPTELEGIIRRENTLDKDGVIPGIFHLNKDFTKETFDDALNRSYPVLHIASHFHLVNENIASSYLVLGDGKPLSLRQIAEGELDFNGIELLTLSACNTALGIHRANGREVEGFAALAQSMGAKGVLATLWSVNDKSTSTLMQHLYYLRELGAGLTKAEALRQAQLTLLHPKRSISINDQSMRLADSVSSKDQHPEVSDKFEANTVAKYAHPFYWAPFILIGNWL